MKTFLSSPLGSFVKGFLSILIAMYVSEIVSAGSIFIPMDKDMISKLVIAGVVPNIQILINWINPEYKNYGKNKTE